MMAKLEGKKFDGQKPRWDLLPFRAAGEVVKVLTLGAQKYTDDNWRLVPRARRRYLAAMLRHIAAYGDGEQCDPETGCHHLAHAVCCALFMVSFDLGVAEEVKE